MSTAWIVNEILPHKKLKNFNFMVAVFMLVKVVTHNTVRWPIIRSSAEMGVDHRAL